MPDLNLSLEKPQLRERAVRVMEALIKFHMHSLYG